MRGETRSVNPLSAAEIEQQQLDPSFLVWLLARSTQELVEAAIRPTGLSADEFAIYSILSAAPGITPGELSRWMAAPRSSMTSYLKRLEHRGHITRTADRTDRRSYQITLTAAGRRTHERARALFGPTRTRLIEDLSYQDGRIREALLHAHTVIDTLRVELATDAEGSHS